MSLSPQDAAAALHDIQAAERRSATLHGYRQGAPHLILWGVLWALGYGQTDLRPAYAQTIWAVVTPIGDRCRLRHFARGPQRRKAYRRLALRRGGGDLVRVLLRHILCHGAGQRPPGRRFHSAVRCHRLCPGERLARLALRHCRHRGCDPHARGLCVAPPALSAVDGRCRRRRADPRRALAQAGLR